MKFSILFCLFVLIVCANSLTCPQLTVTQSLRTSWTNADGSKYYLYDLAFTNGYSESVSDVVFTISSKTSGYQLINQDGSLVSSSWNMQELSYTHPTDLPFTLVLDNKVTSIPAGSTYTSAGYIVGSTETLVSATVSCSRVSSTATTTSVVNPSTTGTQLPPTSTTTGSSGICLASGVTTLQTGESWTDDVYSYSQWTVTLTNLGTLPLKSAELTISYDNTFGDFSQVWNMVSTGFPTAGQSFTVNLFNLQPGVAFSGAGFILRVPLATLNDPGYHLGHYSYPYTQFVTASHC